MNIEFIDELTEFINYFISKYDLNIDSIVLLNTIISENDSDESKIKKIINNTIIHNNLNYKLL